MTMAMVMQVDMTVADGYDGGKWQMNVASVT
jgi:hypothetical protein